MCLSGVSTTAFTREIEIGGDGATVQAAVALSNRL
jgi:hypothetical protein